MKKKVMIISIFLLAIAGIFELAHVAYVKHLEQKYDPLKCELNKSVVSDESVYVNYDPMDDYVEVLDSSEIIKIY